MVCSGAFSNVAILGACAGRSIFIGGWRLGFTRTLVHTAFVGKTSPLASADEHLIEQAAGVVPVIVNTHSGSVEFFGSAGPLIEILAEYEKRFVGG